MKKENILEKVKRNLKARWNKRGNVKVGRMWTYSALMGNDHYYIPALDMEVTGTCGKHCDCCKNDCYVKKSYRYPSVILGHALNTLAMRLNPVQAGIDLSSAIKRAKNKPDVCRYDQSGEIESNEQLAAFIYAAAENPDVTFYIYTKAYDFIIPALLSGLVPENMIVLISVWHEYGIQEFNSVKHLKNVKAFVYDDRSFDYSAAGLDIQTYCHAYDEYGKLDHNVTCTVCKKCFNYLDSCKVVGCYSH